MDSRAKATKPREISRELQRRKGAVTGINRNRRRAARERNQNGGKPVQVAVMIPRRVGLVTVRVGRGIAHHDIDDVKAIIAVPLIVSVRQERLASKRLIADSFEAPQLHRATLSLSVLRVFELIWFVKLSLLRKYEKLTCGPVLSLPCREHPDVRKKITRPIAIEVYALTS